MKALVIGALLVLAAAPARAERVVTPEGWYEVEEGSGETQDAEIVIIVAQDDQGGTGAADGPARVQPPPGEPPPPAQPPTLQDEIAAFQRVNCAEVRGEYLRRVMELHGLTSPFPMTDSELLSALTWTRPPAGGGFFGVGTGLGDPALSLLYGEPPVPPGALSYDFKLQQLAPQVVECLAREQQGPAPAVRPPPPGPPAPEMQPGSPPPENQPAPPPPRPLRPSSASLP